MLKIAFDVGGVLSTYPDKFRPLLDALGASSGVEVWIISDMHPEQKIIDTLRLNGIRFLDKRVRSADYDKYGNACKAVLCKELEIDILIDDFVGYLADGDHIRLLLMPNSSNPYYHENWKTDGSEADFGRRKYTKT